MRNPEIGAKVRFKTVGEVICHFSSSRIVIELEGGRWLEASPEELEEVEDEDHTLA